MTLSSSFKFDFNRRSTAEQVTEGVDLSDKTILITGVGSGLGYETLRVLAKRGAHVIGIDRTMDAAKKACDETPGVTTPFACDLSDPDSIVACSKAISEQFSLLDVVITNDPGSQIQRAARVTVRGKFSGPFRVDKSLDGASESSTRRPHRPGC